MSINKTCPISSFTSVDGPSAIVRKILRGVSYYSRPFIYSIRCDPNGIRTRVTAVKGRCPRPLDDRVNEAAQYSIRWRQGNRTASSGGFGQIDRPGRSSRGGAPMGFQDLTRRFRHFFPFFRVGQQLRHRPSQLSRGFDLNCSALTNEGADQRREIFHVWTEQNRFTRQDRFCGILPAAREQTFADEDKSCR